jgi:hypothetical protein
MIVTHSSGNLQQLLLDALSERGSLKEVLEFVSML